jgi:alcohol dehydrogenase (cytochrome c)
MIRPIRLGFVAAGLWLVACSAAAQTARSYSPVTDARLESPEARNWLMYLRQYDSWSYSPLNRINTRNVADLVPVWTMSTGTAEGHQAPPIVNDGVMFVTTPFNQVLAIDAKTGDLLWRYRHQIPADIRMGHPTNRGVALYGDRVYTATSDARVVALDARTGAVVWNKAVEDYNGGYHCAHSLHRDCRSAHQQARRAAGSRAPERLRRAVARRPRAGRVDVRVAGRGRPARAAHAPPAVLH